MLFFRSCLRYPLGYPSISMHTFRVHHTLSPCLVVNTSSPPPQVLTVNHRICTRRTCMQSAVSLSVTYMSIPTYISHITTAHNACLVYSSDLRSPIPSFTLYPFYLTFTPPCCPYVYLRTSHHRHFIGRGMLTAGRSRRLRPACASPKLVYSYSYQYSG
ncbi:hypothetical protein BD311DRAFT_165981 [Dichomitus squalens]|uniref:Uncharacterized protein n=1 Tax=Dichomitus squalens TaxID=114155 RepID=A0A4V2JYR3_9APHY|nr:hypothetical protein BD311DRAFT_165981 [Dichomitus squalens]